MTCDGKIIYNYISMGITDTFFSFIETIRIYVKNFIQNYGVTTSHMFAFTGIIAYIIVFYLLINNYKVFQTYAIATNSIFFISVILMILFSAIRFNGTDTLKQRFTSVIFNSVIVIIGLIVIYFFINTMMENERSPTIIGYFTQILALFATLYLLHTLLSKTKIVRYLLENRVFSLLYHFLFLIPCYLFEGGVYVYENLKTTPMYVIYLLIAQIIFITGYYFYPYVESKIIYNNGIILQKNPVHTNKQTIVKQNKLLSSINKNVNIQNVDVSSSINKDLQYKYGISAWIFINNQGSNTSETSDVLTPLLTYGKHTGMFYNASTNTFQITSKKGMDGTEVIYTSTDIPLQKWNNIIMNYNSGKVDVFLNGILVATKSDIIPYVTLDTITIGTDNGVQGGIKNVVFYDEPLSKIMIDWINTSQ